MVLNILITMVVKNEGEVLNTWSISLFHFRLYFCNELLLQIKEVKTTRWGINKQVLQLQGKVRPKTDEGVELNKINAEDYM